MIIGHKRQIEYFEKVISKGALAHAYLFFGPERVGKRAFARAVATAMLCEKKNAGIESCGACQSCEKAERGQHGNITVLSISETIVSKKEERKDIPIEDIRELKRMLSFAPAGSAWRIIIMDGVERMSLPAANAFLKILEEPPEQTLFLLITSEPEHVLETIRSRAEEVYFSLVGPEDIREFLAQESIPKSRYDEIIRVAAGRAGVAVSAVREKDEFEEEKKFLESVEIALSRGAPHFFPFTERAASDEVLRSRAASEVVRILERRMQEEKDFDRALALAKRMKNVVHITEVMAQTNVNPRTSLDLIFMEGADV